MGVSRQTFGRTVEAARRKVARALVQGLVLRIEVPEAEAASLPTVRAFVCAACAHAWTEPFGTGRPDACPACDSENFRRKGCHGASACGPATEDPNA
jgi:hypothetical protein